MNCRKVTSLVKPALLTLCAVAFSVSTSHTTLANSKTNVPTRLAITVLNTKQGKTTLLRIIRSKARTNPKFAKALSTACGCAVIPEEEEGFGSCFGNCLRSNGVSLISLASCGGVCSVNLVGCAVCVGVSEWVVLGCAQYCVWFGGGGGRIGNLEGRQLRPPRIRGLQQAKLSSPNAHLRVHRA
jgi:hypothetical protein